MYSGLSNKFRQPAFIDKYLFQALMLLCGQLSPGYS